jgi:hypothetical protein
MHEGQKKDRLLFIMECKGQTGEEKRGVDRVKGERKLREKEEERERRTVGSEMNEMLPVGPCGVPDFRRADAELLDNGTADQTPGGRSLQIVSFDLKSHQQARPDLVRLLLHLQTVRVLSADNLPSLVQSRPHELGATNSLDADLRNLRPSSKKSVHATQVSHGRQLTARKIRSTMAPHHLKENGPPFASSQHRDV